MLAGDPAGVGFLQLKRVVPFVCLWLTGCYGGVYVQSGMPSGTTPAVRAQASFPGQSVVGAVIIGVMLVDGARYYVRYPDGARMPYYGVPESDPSRRINVQDCTQPIDLAAGNLMCR